MPLKGFRSVACLATLLSVPLAIPTVACAATFGSAAISYENALLSQFNLVTLGDLTQTAGPGAETIAGRALVGGNATFVSGASVCTGSNCATASSTGPDSSRATFGALTVFGNLVAPGSNSSSELLKVGTGDVSVRGTSQGNILFNGNGSTASGTFRQVGSAQNLTNIGNATAIKTSQSTFKGNSYTYNSSTGVVTGYGATPQTGVSAASVFPFTDSFKTNAKDLASGLASLPGSPGVKTQVMTSGDSIFFTANADYVVGGKSYGVVTTKLSDLSKMTNFKGVNNGSNEATFVIVTVDGDYTLPNLNSYVGDERVIFDFVSSSSFNLKFAGNWNGSILAPMANITSMGGTIDGSVIVNYINQTQALYANNLFAGDLTGLIPEPASIALMGAGLVVLGAIRHRRKRAA